MTKIKRVNSQDLGIHAVGRTDIGFVESNKLRNEPGTGLDSFSGPVVAAAVSWWEGSVV